MVLLEDKGGVYLSMQNYIKVMAIKLGVDTEGRKLRRVPMSKPIEDMTPCTEEECAKFRSATGMVGWLSSTGRCELRQYHSRASQYMAAPVRGALEAIMGIVEYCLDNKDLCLHQPWGTEGVEWRFYTDSDQSSNSELNNKRRSQLSYLAMKGRAPIMFGSKASSVKFGPDLDGFGVNHCGPSRPRCHSAIDDLHADGSSAAAEICAASVSLNEMLHLGYVTDEMGFGYPTPIELCVDNSMAVAFSQGQTRRSKMRHIDSRQSWVEALRDDNIVKFKWVPTKDNLADIGAKLLDTLTFEWLRDELTVRKGIPTVPRAAAPDV
jgi:hypothetical protein